MNSERSISVSVTMTLSFEVEKHPASGRENCEIAAESAVADLKAYLARYPYGRVEAINRLT